MTGFVMLNFEKFIYSFKEKFDILGNTAYYLFSCQELYRKIDIHSYKLNMKQLSEDELKQRQTASMAV